MPEVLRGHDEGDGALVEVLVELGPYRKVPSPVNPRWLVVRANWTSRARHRAGREPRERARAMAAMLPFSWTQLTLSVLVLTTMRSRVCAGQRGDEVAGGGLVPLGLDDDGGGGALRGGGLHRGGLVAAEEDRRDLEPGAGVGVPVARQLIGRRVPDEHDARSAGVAGIGERLVQRAQVGAVVVGGRDRVIGRVVVDEVEHRPGSALCGMSWTTIFPAALAAVISSSAARSTSGPLAPSSPVGSVNGTAPITSTGSAAVLVDRQPAGGGEVPSRRVARCLGGGLPAVDLVLVPLDLHARHVTELVAEPVERRLVGLAARRAQAEGVELGEQVAQLVRRGERVGVDLGRARCRRIRLGRRWTRCRPARSRRRPTSCMRSPAAAAPPGPPPATPPPPARGGRGFGWGGRRA